VVTDRVAGLVAGEELEEALEGLEPEQITGAGGLVSQLAGRVIETALGAELTEHLGYPPGQARPGGTVTIATARRRSRCRPISGRWRSRRGATAMPALSPGSWASARRGWRASTSGS